MMRVESCFTIPKLALLAILIVEPSQCRGGAN